MSSDHKPLHILSLEAENVKRLRAVKIEPKGRMVPIGGRNGQGKTSVLDAIWWALAGTKSVQAEPIRKGADKALIRLDLGDYIVRRTFSRKEGGDPPYTTSLRVETADGGSVRAPQTIVDSFIGALTFDPLEFERGSPKDQFDALRKFVPGLDFEKFDQMQRGYMERRRDINREASKARSAAELIDTPDDFQPIDETDLLDQLTRAGEINAQIEARRARREAVERSASDAEDAARVNLETAAQKRNAAAALIQEAERLEAEASELTEDAADARERLAKAEALPELVDVAATRDKLNEARAHNARGARAAEKKRLLAEAEDLEAQSEKLTKAMAAREEAKREAIAKAKMPVDGLSFGDNCILLNGVPFEQASDAERLRASIAIAMVSNSDLRVVRVRDGSLLDDDAMRVLADMAEKNDCQVWIERVGGVGPSGFVIEDGEISNG